MTKLIRFHYWLIDKESIISAKITWDGEQCKNEYEKKQHRITINLKDGQIYTLRYEDLYEAQKDLDLLTIDLDATDFNTNFKHYINRRLHQCINSITSLQMEVRKLMKSFSVSKKKLKKKVIDL
jgi:hypothetical protein